MAAAVKLLQASAVAVAEGVVAAEVVVVVVCSSGGSSPGCDHT